MVTRIGQEKPINTLVWMDIKLERLENNPIIIVVVGEGDVGKSTLIKYLISETYEPHKITMGVGFEFHKMEINGEEVEFAIKDAGA